MKRHILGVLAATVAAPYLTFLMINVMAVGSIIVEAPQRFDPLDLLRFIRRGTEALLFVGLPLFLIASFLAFFLHVFEHGSRRASAVAGMIPGLLFALAFAPEHPWYRIEFVLALLHGMIPGTICGWIYWVIAVEPRKEHAPPLSHELTS